MTVSSVVAIILIAIIILFFLIVFLNLILPQYNKSKPVVQVSPQSLSAMMVNYVIQCDGIIDRKGIRVYNRCGKIVIKYKDKIKKYHYCSDAQSYILELLLDGAWNNSYYQKYIPEDKS